MPPALAAIVSGAITGTLEQIDSGIPLATQALLITSFGFVQQTCRYRLYDPEERSNAITELRAVCHHYHAHGVVLITPDLPPLPNHLMLYVEVRGNAWQAHSTVQPDGKGHCLDATFEDGSTSVFMPLLEFPPGEPVSPAPACAS